MQNNSNAALDSINNGANSDLGNFSTETLEGPGDTQFPQVEVPTVLVPEERDEEYLMLKEVACTSTQYLKKNIARPGVIGPVTKQLNQAA